MSKVTIQTISSWYRPMHCVASGKAYRVDKFVFFHPELKEVVLTYNHSWLENTRGQDIKSIELPQTELKRKTKANLSLNEAFVISLGKEDYGTDYLCELYIPINMLNIKFVEYKMQGGYLYAYWTGDQDILIKEYKGNTGQHKSLLRNEYEELLEQISGYNLEYHTIDTLDNIQLLYQKALEFNKEAERVKNLTIDEAITEVIKNEK
jgi:hypothetical protein